MSSSQDGGDTVSVVLTPDYDAMLTLGKHFNANLDWSAQHCVAGEPPLGGATVEKQVKPKPWWKVW